MKQQTGERVPGSLPETGQDWPGPWQEELAKASRNGCVGRKVVAENFHARIWRTRLRPGERIAFHCHVLDHLFIALSDGRLQSRDPSGRAEIHAFGKGASIFRHIPLNDCHVRDLENVGEAAVSYVIVEFLGSANEPLPVPDHVRRK